MGEQSPTAPKQTIKPLSAVFRENGSPFTVDMTPVKNLESLLSAPETLKTLQSVPNLQVMTDTQIRGIIAQTGHPDYFETVQKLREQKQPAERLEFMQSFVTSFMGELKKQDPGLHDHFSALIEKQAQSDFEDYSALNDDPMEKFRTLAAFTAIKKLESSYGVYHFDATENLPAAHLFKIPDQSFDKNANFDDHTGNREKKILSNLIQNQPPGTNQEWAAIITVHELGHVGDLNKAPQEDYFRRIKESHPQTDFDYNIAHANETDQDLNMVRALKDVVSKDVLDYWAAYRVALQSNAHIRHAQDTIDKGGNIVATDDIYVPPSHGHDTGLYLMEYMQTGIVPDYYATATTTNSFFEKTLRSMDSKTASTPPAIPEFLGAVRSALKAEPPVYSPAEEQIAQNYLHAMQDVLGIKAEELKPEIRQPVMAATQNDPSAPSSSGAFKP